VRLRLSILLAIVLVVGLGAVAYVLHVHTQQAAAIAAAPKVATTNLASVTSQRPYLVFRNTALGPGYGQVAVVPLSAPDGPRGLTPASCDRVYARGADSICLASQGGLITTYQTEIYGPTWLPLQVTPLAGQPSRARMSPDGSLTATTTFVYGDSYTNPGQFSTRTIVSHSGGSQIADIEQFTLTVRGKVINASDKNFWGVTFADDDTFYATAAFSGVTWLVRGSLSSHKMVGIRSDVECPSLSPDGTRIAFKKHGNLSAGRWQLAVYDLATGKETVLAEKRSVDDQVEWLDDSHILYGMPRSDASGGGDDIWVVPADGTGSPKVFVHNAWSPAVVR
jgi:hypothetical protein